MPIKRFRKKPIIIEAIQFDATNENLVELSNWLPQGTLLYGGIKNQIVIKTLEGNMVAHKGDWIIKGIKGECYPCAPDIFEITYEAVSDG